MSAVPPPAAAADGEFFGISAPELYSMSLDGRHELRDRGLAAIEAAGIEAVRTEIGWRDVEPNAPLLGLHSYRWPAVDEHVVALAERSQRLMPMMLAPPAWAQAADSASACGRRGMVAEAHIDDYADLTAAIARRYGRGGALWEWAASQRPDLPQRPITTYEIWNEPNWDAFSCPVVEPEVYARALAAAADAIHAVDPEATVTVGGLVVLERDAVQGERMLGMQTSRFLERMVAAVPALAAKIDAVAVHTYWATPADNLRAISLLEGWLEGVGLGAERLIVSEFGWQTSSAGNATTEAAKTEMVGRYAEALAREGCRIEAIFPHSWITARADPLNPEHWYGLADPATGAPMAAGAAYAEAIADSAGTAGAAGSCGRPPAADPPPAPADPGPGPSAEPGRPAIRLIDPPRKTADRTPAIRFELVGASAGTLVAARLDRRRWHRARSPLRLPRLRRGAHVVRLRARVGGATVAKRALRFRVTRPRR